MSAEQWRAQRPPLSDANALVLQVWEFCGGWNPQALPLALAYYDIDDAGLMLDQLLALKALIDARAEAQRSAAHGPIQR